MLENMKQFFKFVYSKLDNETGNGQLIYLLDNHGNQLYGDIKIAETFNKKFVKNFNSTKISSSCPRGYPDGLLFNCLSLT